MKKLLIVLGLLVLGATNVYAQPGGGGRPGGERGAPPEAIEACSGKQSGDSAEFTSPFGDVVSGICEEVNGQMVLKPDNPPQGNMEPQQ